MRKRTLTSTSTTPIRKDLRDLTKLLWTNISMHSQDRHLQNLMLAGATDKDDKTMLCLQLAQHLSELNKKVLLIDFDKQGSRFKRHLKYDSNEGFTDYCFHLFDQPLYTRHVTDYGFNDLLFLFHIKKRTGQLVLISDDHDPCAIHFYKGTPVHFVSAGKNLKDEVISDLENIKGQTLTDFRDAPSPSKPGTVSYTPLLEKEICTTQELKILIEKHLLSFLTKTDFTTYYAFDFAEKNANAYSFFDTLNLETPAVWDKEYQENDFLLKTLKKYTIQASQGFDFLPCGRFPLKSGDFSRKFKIIQPLLKQQYDSILINAPKISEQSPSLEIGPCLDGTVLIVKSGEMDRRQLRSVLDQMKKAKIPLIGTVLNEVPEKHFLPKG